MLWRMDLLDGMDRRCLTVVLILLLHRSPWTECNAQTSTIEPSLPSKDLSDSDKTVGNDCMNDNDCSRLKNGVCDTELRKCVCPEIYPLKDDIACYEGVPLNYPCVVDIQCEYLTANSFCDRNTHVCRCVQSHLFTNSTNGTSCIFSNPDPGVSVDYTVLGVMTGMALMFIVMCVVLRMFSKARFPEQRTIFNSPRLLKLSLARKNREPTDSRRGSRASVPSRQPSVYSGLNLPGRSPTGSHASGERRSLGSATQSPIDERKTLARNANQVTVAIKGGIEDGTSSRTNQV